MRIAVFSDIHGNCVALDAVLSDIERESVDKLVCLGDAVQGGSQPAETVSRLRGLRIPTVMGNSDSWLLTGENTSATEQVSEAHKAMRAWSLSKLTEEDLEFIGHFNSIITLPLENESLVCFHGSPESFDELIWPTTPDEKFAQLMRGYGDSMLCGGHTHLQWLRRFKDSFYFNPGSVGFSFDHSQKGDEIHADGWAEYAIISSDKKASALEFRRVPFDAKEWIRVTARSGSPNVDRISQQYSARV
jgi:putative phosphoesterase